MQYYKRREKMQHDFTKGNVAKSLLLFAIPIFGANILQAMYGTVDLLVVGLFLMHRQFRRFLLRMSVQGILSTFLVRIPVSYFMSKMPHVTLFQVGFATSMATVFAIVITAMYGNKSIVRRSVCSNGRRAAYCIFRQHPVRRVQLRCIRPSCGWR